MTNAKYDIADADTQTVPARSGRDRSGESANRDDAPGQTSGLSRARIAAIFAALLVAMIVASLDHTIVATALPTIVGELGGVNRMLWVTTAYILASTVMMPIYGRAGDVLGRKPLFLGALGLLAIGTAVCGFAPSMEWLIAGRAVQGLGGGGLIILTQAIVADVVPARERAKYMGIMGVAYIVPLIAGPLLGGLFTDTIGWRWAFWTTVPLMGIAGIVAAALLPKNRRMRMGEAAFDPLGTAFLTAAVIAFILATSWGGVEYAWGSPAIIGLIVAAVAFAALFVFAESRAKAPVMPLSLFKNRTFVLTTVAGMVTTFAMMGAIAYLPTYFQIVDGMSAIAAGYMEIPMDAAWLVSSVAAGFFISKKGTYKTIMAASFVVMGVGVAALATISAELPVAAIAVYLAVFGLGMGMSFEILILIAQNEFPASEVGVATAAANFFREVGTTLGSSVVGALFIGGLSSTLDARLAHLGGQEALGVGANSLTPAIVRELPDGVHQAVSLAYNDALVPVFIGMVPLMAVGFICMVFMKEKPLANEPQE